VDSIVEHFASYRMIWCVNSQDWSLAPTMHFYWDFCVLGNLTATVHTSCWSITTQSVPAMQTYLVILLRVLWKVSMTVVWRLCYHTGTERAEGLCMSDPVRLQHCITVTCSDFVGTTTIYAWLCGTRITVIKMHLDLHLMHTLCIISMLMC